MRGGSYFLTLVAFVTFSGCALTDVRLKPPELLQAPIPGGNERQVIVAVPFADAREIKNRCGAQKGGYGNETADAICVGNPAEWLAVYLARELKASGFTVLSTESGARESALKVEGVLLKIFAEPVVGFWTTTVETDLNVKLVATSRTGLRAERTFFVKGERTSIAWPEGVFNDSLEDGTGKLLTTIVEAILELMKQYPELGFRQSQPAVVAWRSESGQ